MYCSLPGSSVHGIFQARILECVAISFSRGSSPHRDQTQVSPIAGRLFTVWTTREGFSYSSVQLLSRVRLFVTPWIAARQASLSITNSRSSFRLTSIASVMPSSILGTYWPGEFLFQYPIILPFHTIHGVLKARILKWFAIPFSSGPHCVRPLHYACPSWVAPQDMA